ncbi:phosphoglucomutase [Treponema sp.]|uniref:phosphoglucomutase n=1 Tax=Treponema sp. TaxID=166 RepID=UPI00388DBAF2
MKHNMITSASGWRKVFACSGDEKDNTPEITEEDKILVGIAADVFSDYIMEKTSNPTVILGMDTRPTGRVIAYTMLRLLMSKKIAVNYTGIIAAPEIMAYSKTVDGFIYISASHNPIGHNGIKFGLNDGGVLNGEENAKLVKLLNERINSESDIERVKKLIATCPDEDIDWVLTESVAVMREASSMYHSFSKQVISGTENIARQNRLFAQIRQNVLSNPFGIVCDMNGSARTLSIDSSFFRECGINYFSINDKPGEINHAIIPEPENLLWCAAEMERLHEEGHTEVQLGYMPDCDGDRGNIVYWNEKENKALPISAQEVFALSVLAELAYESYTNELEDSSTSSTEKRAVAANCPTSMRIDEICRAFGAELFRAEVGEANVVNLARKKREEGYTVRILGEGSNGGNITHPAAVRDPVNTIFALIKLLVLRDTIDENGRTIKGLFHIWCDATAHEYNDDFTLSDVIATLPVYTTTGVAEERAVLKIKTTDHSVLKAKFQKIFEYQWKTQKEVLFQKYGIVAYEAVATVGTEEIRNLKDFSKSGKGGLKIVFYNQDEVPCAFIWMRGSGTEPVFRVMSDVKGNNKAEEAKLLEWERQMILKADKI